MEHQRKSHISRRTIAKLSRIMAVVIMLGCSLAAIAAPDSRKAKKTDQRAEQPFTVVIDAGHGGHDYGAIDNGANEKDINLAVAKKLAENLKKKGKNVKVVLTRDDDTFISLQERANIANRNKGNLFISIHTNSVDKNNANRKNVSGASVYALGPQKDANNLKVAQRENSVIELEDDYHQKYSGFDPSKDESYIIFEMAQKKNLGQSLKFAHKAQRELVSTAGRKDRGVKQAGFWVLWATSMPSVLVELDFICNPDASAFLTSDKGRDKLAQALTNATLDYIETDRKKNVARNSDADTDVNATAGLAADVDSESAVSTLAASRPKVEKKREHVNIAAATNTSAPRRRRSDNARKKSENRDLQTDNIIVRSESEFMASTERQDVKPALEESTAKAGSHEKEDKSKKNKKKGKTKESNKTSQKTTAQKVNNDKTDRKGNSSTKTFVVQTPSKAKIDSVSKAMAQPKASRPVIQTPSENGKRYYTILLLDSDRELNSDDPAFCEITPSGMFRENGHYKYTYGRSDNRGEIEQQLLRIKSILPQATIVVRSN